MTIASTKEIILSSLAASLTAGFMFLVATQPTQAAPIIPEEEITIIHQEVEDPSALEVLVDDVLIDCGSTHYHHDGCSVGVRGITW